MSTAARRAEYFALEAREYLAELQPAANLDSPDLEKLVRGARALRGAALMAGLGTYARAAAGLEALARQVRDHATPWTPGAKAGWLDGLQTLRDLTERAPAWEAVDDRAALALADRIERVAGGGTAKVAVPATPALTPGVRAFIARESAMIAGSLAEAARALAPTPPQAALAAVLERMRALRGLGGSAELSPLPELLDAMEMATRTLLSDVPPPPNVAELFSEAGRVLGAMAASMAEDGRVEQPRELAPLAEALLYSYAAERDVVPITALAPDRSDSLLRRGTPPIAMGDATPVSLELLGVGDHMLQSAEALQRATSSAATDLRLFVLHRTLATMPPRSPTGRFLAPLAHALAAAVGAGLPRGDLDRFLTLLRESGVFLTHAGNAPTDADLLKTRDQLAAKIMGAALHATRDGAPAIGSAQGILANPWQPPALDLTAAPEPEDTAVEEPIAIEALAPELPIVSIESLGVEDVIVSIDSLAPEEVVVSIDSLAPDDAPIVSIDDLAPSRPEPTTVVIPAIAAGIPTRLEAAFQRRRALELQQESAPSAPDTSADSPPIPIEQLLYRGDAALHRAIHVREEITHLLAEPTVSLERLRPHIQELLDLVPLARDAA